MKKLLEVQPKVGKNYPIIIDQEIDFSYLMNNISGRKVLVVTNTTVSLLHLREIRYKIEKSCSFFDVCILPDGEIYKNFDSLKSIYNKLLKNNFNRDSCIIALGGGVVGDVAAFAASTYQRGIDIIQIPTTLLSQVDSSVGGKTGINYLTGKNMIGTFYQPKIVLISTNMINSLPQSEFSSGMSEVIKYGCILSKSFFSWIEKNAIDIKLKKPTCLVDLIEKSCKFKADIIRKDEKEEMDLRVLLNLGHTFGHAIEFCQDYEGLKHGEAVGVGIALAAKFSLYLNLLAFKQVEKILDLLTSFDIPINFPKSISLDDLVSAMETDKKNTSNNITLILLNSIGKAVIKKNFSKSIVKDILQKILLN